MVQVNGVGFLGRGRCHWDTSFSKWKTLDAAWHYVQRSRPSPALVVGTVVR